MKKMIENKKSKLKGEKMKNKTNRYIGFVATMLFLLMIKMAFSTVPNTINLHGRLTDDSGSSLEGTYNMSFKIYTDYSGGTHIYEKNLTVTTDSKGVYNVILTDVNLDFDEQYYLGIEVDDDSEMTPRMNLTTMPSAFRANTSEDLICTDCVDGSDLADSITLDANLSIESGTLFIDYNNDRVGIGTTGPSQKLDVNGTAVINDRLYFTDSSVQINEEGNNRLALRGTGGISFFPNYSGGWEEKMRITSDGNVGIGTTDPNVTLHVVGDINVTAGNDICIEGGNCLSEAGSGSVGGSGEANRAAFWTGSSTLSYDNNFTWDNTNKRLGIGTTGPGVKLHVIGDDESLADSTSGVTFIGTGTSKIQIGYDSSTSSGYGWISATKNPSTWSHLVLMPNGYGNVGIGTTSPGYKLEIASADKALNVSGNLYVNSTNVGIGISSPAAKLHVVGNSASESLAVFRNDYDANDLTISSISGDATLVLRTGAGDKLQLTTHNTNNNGITIDTSGNVGIGTTTPGSLLHINGTGTKLNLSYSEAIYSTIDTNQYGNLLLNSQAGGIYFQTGGSSRGYFDGTNWIFNSGNVGIGTTSPNYKLEIADSDAALNVSGNLYVNSTNVGIGTASPGYALELSSSLGNLLKLTDGTVNIETRILSSYATFGVGTAHDLRLRTSNTDRLTISSSGNVGIGTTSPADKLHVNNGNITLKADGYDALIRIYSDDSGDATPTYIWSEDTVGFAVGSTPGTPDFVVNGAGYVGIGTTEPSEALEISDGTDSITFAPDAGTPTMNTTNSQNLTITSDGGSVIIKLA
ncbi:hypothetical protein JXB41_05300 [Candidatus Woesearchaeota archaeon]|nr:hypothetical protein [Candidatus Woesearchaeota archaeon]